MPFIHLMEIILLNSRIVQRQKTYVNFWKKIVKENKGKIVVLILDNPKTHHSIKTVTKAKELGIILVFLPPYSPDLNPVEYVWKTIKREVSVTFVQSKQHLRNIIKKRVY